MKKSLIAVNVLLVVLFVMGLMEIAYADSAEVLPKGRSKVNVSGAYYFPIDTRFDPDGDEEDIAADYNATLNNYIFPVLAVFENSLGGPLPDGTANVGDSNVSFEIKAQEYSIDYQYGLTDKITVGIHVPYSYYKRDVSAELITTNATIGKSPIGTNFGLPLVPLAADPFGDAQRLAKGDVFDLLSGGLDVNNDGSVDIPGYGYERFESWSNNGIGDITLGGRYQYFKNEKWRLAFTGGVSLPTGDGDNPDNLLDMPFGLEAWALLFQVQNDYLATENLVLDFTFKYDLVLPDNKIERISRDVNIPITANREEVERDIGDKFVFDTSATYKFNEGLSGSLQYQYWKRWKDEIDGNQGFAYESLEDETDITAHMFLIGVSYSTIPMFLEEKFPVPLILSLTYENVFAGSNNFLKQQDIIFNLAVLF